MGENKAGGERDRPETGRAEGGTGVKIAVLTSGGDCCGMNAALRAIVRTALAEGAAVYGVEYGYAGLLENRIVELGWDWAEKLSTEGGTVLHTARCPRFRTRKGQRVAARNLIQLGIDNLIVIGGDGTFRGALDLKRRYRRVYAKLLESGQLEEHLRHLHALAVVGIPGTIDCDIYGTDITLGADTALHRISEVVSRLYSTMRSHRRICVLETMGNKCGWLALMAGAALDADYILVPEVRKAWREELVRTVEMAVEHCKADILVVLSEGALDVDGRQVTLDDVAGELSQYDPRTQCVGHIQRGGCPSARDVVQGTLSGISAARHLIGQKYDSFSEVTHNRDKMVGFCEDEVVLVDLRLVVSENRRTDGMVERGESVFSRRSEAFQRVYETYEHHRVRKLDWHRLGGLKGASGQLHNRNGAGVGSGESGAVSGGDAESVISNDAGSDIVRCHNDVSTLPLLQQAVNLSNEMAGAGQAGSKGAGSSSEYRQALNIAILNSGEITAGMNCCLNMLVQSGICAGHRMFYFTDGYEGMGALKEAGPFQFRRDSCVGGAVIGASGGQPRDVGSIRACMENHSIDWLIVVGELRNVEVVKELDNVILIPTESSGHSSADPASFRTWDMCLGYDSTLNGIMCAAAICKTSAGARERIAYIMEVPGRKQCIAGALACGAFDVICDIFEGSVANAVQEIERIKEKTAKHFATHRKAGLVILRSLDVMPSISTHTLAKILSEGAVFTVRHCVPGPLSSGDSVSPYDQLTAGMAASEAMKAVAQGSGSGIAGTVAGKASFVPAGKLGTYGSESRAKELKSMLDYCRHLENKRR